MNQRRLRIERAVREATEPDGRPRFYPPLEHPAHYRQRKMLEKLRELDGRMPYTSSDLAAAIGHCEQQIATVEACQARDLHYFVTIVGSEAERDG